MLHVFHGMRLYFFKNITGCVQISQLIVVQLKLKKKKKNLMYCC